MRIYHLLGQGKGLFTVVSDTSVMREDIQDFSHFITAELNGSLMMMRIQFTTVELFTKVAYLLW